MSMYSINGHTQLAIILYIESDSTTSLRTFIYIIIIMLCKVNFFHATSLATDGGQYVSGEINFTDAVGQGTRPQSWLNFIIIIAVSSVISGKSNRV